MPHDSFEELLRAHHRVAMGLCHEPGLSSVVFDRIRAELLDAIESGDSLAAFRARLRHALETEAAA